MNRVEFMKQLERLLWDIPENDRLDAIAYYNGYFDEAGTENEANAIRELGSPEKVAAIIKADLNTAGNERAEYTENGYSDGRSSENPNIPTKRGKGYQESKQKRNIPWVLIIIILVLASPMIFGIGAGLFGGLIGVLAGAFGLIVALAGCGIGFLTAGVVCFVVGIFRVVVTPLDGLVTIGIGALLIAAGLLCIVLFAWIAFKWIPSLFRVFVDSCQKIFRRGERGSVA